MEEIKVKVEIFFISHEDKGERIILVNGEEIYRDSQKYWLHGKEKSVFRDFENWLDELCSSKEFDNGCCTTDQTRERGGFFKIRWAKFFGKSFKFKS